MARPPNLRSYPSLRLTRSAHAQVMKGRGWKEVEAQEDWDFFYADVGWIHENITYAQVHDKPWSPRPPKP